MSQNQTNLKSIFYFIQEHGILNLFFLWARGTLKVMPPIHFHENYQSHKEHYHGLFIFAGNEQEQDHKNLHQCRWPIFHSTMMALLSWKCCPLSICHKPNSYRQTDHFMGWQLSLTSIWLLLKCINCVHIQCLVFANINECQ